LPEARARGASDDEIEAAVPGGFFDSSELMTFIQSCAAAPVPAVGGLGLVFPVGVLAGGGLHQSRKRRMRGDATSSD
jgi:hypothetical protein